MSEADEATPPTVGQLLAVLDLEQLDRDLFRSPDVSTHHPRGMRLFGGQVAAQALRAATRTIEVDHQPHSLHGYFLRPGSPDTPADPPRRPHPRRLVVLHPPGGGHAGRRGDLQPVVFVPQGRGRPGVRPADAERSPTPTTTMPTGTRRSSPSSTGGRRSRCASCPRASATSTATTRAPGASGSAPAARCPPTRRSQPASPPSSPTWGRCSRRPAPWASDPGR